MRIVMAEDSVLLRAGLTRLLEDAGLEVVAAVHDAVGLIEAVERLQPDIVIADVRMPPTHTDEGIRAAVELRARWPHIAVLVLSQYVEERYATELLGGDAAGVGYLLKERVADVREFVDDLTRVAAGGTVLDPEVVAQLFARSRRPAPLATLTPREPRCCSSWRRDVRMPPSPKPSSSAPAPSSSMSTTSSPSSPWRRRRPITAVCSRCSIT